MRPGLKTALLGLAICLPCLIPLLIAAGIGGAAVTALGAWFSDNGLVLAAAAAVALGGAAWYARRRYGR